MQQTNGMTTVISQEQSDLVTSATISAEGQKDPIKNGKSILATKAKLMANLNNNNSATTNQNNSSNKTVPNRTDVIVTNLQHKLNSSKKNVTISEPASNQASPDTNGNGKNVAAAPLPDARAKQVLKEAVDAVVNSFTKHTQGYGRGELWQR